MIYPLAPTPAMQNELIRVVEAVDHLFRRGYMTRRWFQPGYFIPEEPVSFNNDALVTVHVALDVLRHLIREDQERNRIAKICREVCPVRAVSKKKKWPKKRES